MNAYTKPTRGGKAAKGKKAKAEDSDDEEEDTFIGGKGFKK